MPSAPISPPWRPAPSRWLLALTVAAIAVIVLLPGPPAADGQRWLARWLVRVHQTWMPQWVTFGAIETASNVVMFVPLGLFGAIGLFASSATWRARAIVVAAAAALSATIELVQQVALPRRDGSWHDIVANTAGAALGYAIAMLVARRRHRRAQKCYRADDRSAEGQGTP